MKDLPADKEDISNCQSVPDKEEGLGRACPVHSSEIYHLLKDNGSLEKKGKSVILMELSSHEIKYEWRKSIPFHRDITIFKASKVEAEGIRDRVNDLLSILFPRLCSQCIKYNHLFH